jgi:hypothetical protein
MSAYPMANVYFGKRIEYVWQEHLVANSRCTAQTQTIGASGQKGLFTLS